VLLSGKQRSFVAHSDAFITVADGAVRSGKTHAAMIRLAEMCARGPAGDFAIFGKTERTVKRNVVYPLVEGLPGGAVRYVQGSGELYVFGRRCWVVGANDVRAEEKVRGMTLAGAYANEATLYPHELFQQLIDRCSVDGAQILADCNPDSPYHWLMKDYLAAGLPKTDLKRFRFRLDDNPVLSESYKERIKRLHTGLWYRRMVEGEWVVAEGAVYDMLDTTPGGAHVVTELPERFERVVLGVDYGTANPTVFLAAGKSATTWTVFSEARYDGREGRQRTDAEHSRVFREWLEGLGYTPSSIEVDPSGASFKTQLRQDGVSRIRDADHAVLDGIRTVSSGLTEGTLKIHHSCEGLLSEMSTYSWDAKAQERGEDRPLKVADHGPDALRYLAMRALGRPALRVVGKPVGL
jgi:PBSX family phage terminase large subunit